MYWQAQLPWYCDLTIARNTVHPLIGKITPTLTSFAKTLVAIIAARLNNVIEKRILSPLKNSPRKCNTTKIMIAQRLA